MDYSSLPPNPITIKSGFSGIHFFITQYKGKTSVFVAVSRGKITIFPK